MASPITSVEREETEQRSSPLAGPGTTRQNRKLQLRKNGFRGRTLPNRNITPKRKISEAWSSPVQEETPTPEAARLPEASTPGIPTRGRSSSILQEVSNSSLRRKAANKAKHDSVFSVLEDENADEKAWEFESSPACLPLEAPNLTKSKKKQHQRTQSYKSNPDSEQADQHIAYLENELAAYQTQLATLTSPSMTKEKSQKMRILNQEIKRLQDENTRWENEFDERVVQVMEEHTVIENSLRNRINLLEGDTDNYVQKVKELQAQLDAAKKSLDIAEAANIEFERRLETFAHLLVTSPIKAETPLAQPPFVNARRNRQQRLSIHRFPTTGSLPQQTNLGAMQQEFVPITHQEPAINTTHQEPAINTAQAEPAAHTTQEEPKSEAEHVIFDQFDMASDAEWDASKREAFINSASRHSMNLTEMLSQEAPPSSSRARPSRRMRRFHGGSHVPKPLILSAAQLGPILASAPVLEPHESPRSFPFPGFDAMPRRASCHEFSPLTGRRRARTSVDGFELAHMRPLSSSASESTTSSSSSHEQTPILPSTKTDSTRPDYPSIGPNVGRNLFEELCSARKDGTQNSSSSAHITPASTIDGRPLAFTGSSSSSGSQRNVSSNLRLRHQRSLSEATGLSMYPSSRQVSSAYPATSSEPAKSSPSVLAAVVDLCRAPYAIARRCVSRAHSALMLSRTLNRLQWWLLHALLGPLATRRLMACSLHESALLMSHAPRRHRSRQNLNNSTPRPTSADEDDALAYAADSSDAEEETSPCPSRLSRQKTATPRTSTRFETERRLRDEAPMLSRHSPWLWVRFSLTLAFAVAAAIKEGPGALLKECEASENCACLACATRDLKDCAKLE